MGYITYPLFLCTPLSFAQILSNAYCQRRRGGGVHCLRVTRLFLKLYNAIFIYKYLIFFSRGLILRRQKNPWMRLTVNHTTPAKRSPSRPALKSQMGIL